MLNPEKGFDSFLMSGVDFLQVFAEIPQGVIITDAAGVVVFKNKAMASIDDLGIQETLGQRVTDIYDSSEETSMIMRCLHSKQPILSQAFYYRVGSGPLRKVIHSVYPLYQGTNLQGAICFVWDEDSLQKQITNSQALVKDHNRDLGNNTKYTFGDIIGADPEFLHSLRRARSAAANDSPVLIWGETGTGKELFAQAIHNHSSRRNHPFVAINCAAIPDSLQESTLFGTAKGAFTGALDKPGLFEEAKNGTLYLDELDSMPGALQVKLLRVLQEKKLRRLGSSKEIPVKLKIISSLSCNPTQAVQDSTLRADLYYRLGVVFIYLPPLRERQSDISILARHFVSKINCMQGTDVQGISNSSLQKLMACDWPGNVRQLEHSIEAAMNEVGTDRILDDEHFDRASGIGEWSLTEAASLRQGADDQKSELRLLKRSPGDMSLQSLRSKQEREWICRALFDSNGHMSKAAKKLGISRQLLYYKAKKLGVDPKHYR
jgi:arginine utilization regulatory protein